MNYEIARNLINTSDIVFLHRTNDLFSTLISLFTGSRHTHVGIAVWMMTDLGQRRLFLVEATGNGGRRVVLLSKYQGRGMDVVLMPPGVNWEKAETQLMSRVGSMPYGWFDLLQIWVWETLRISLGNARGEVCSEMVANVLRQAGIWTPKRVSPGSLYRTLTGKHKAPVKFSVDR